MNLEKCILMNKNLLLFPIFCLLVSFGVRQPNYCKISRYIAGTYALEFAQPRGLFLTAYGGAMMNDIQEIELRFTSLDALDVDQARKLYVEMMEEFLIRINKHEKIRPHLHNYPFEVKNIKLTISFDDSNRHIRGDGHVAHMFIGRNYTLYYAAYDTEKEDFYDLHKEDYRDALKIVQNVKMDNFPCN